MVDWVLLFAIGLLLGGLVPSHPLLAATVACSLLFMVRRRFSWVKLLGVVLVFGGGGLRAGFATQNFDRAREEARLALGPVEKCAGEAWVVRSPTVVSGKTQLVLSAISFECEGPGKILPDTIFRVYSSEEAVFRGDRVFVVVQLGPLEVMRNQGNDLSHASAIRSGVLLSGGAVDLQILKTSSFSWGGFCDRLRLKARRRISSTYAESSVGMAKALVLGENDLDPSDSEAFRSSGLSHLLAVSGTHIVIAVLGLVKLLESLLRRVSSLSARLHAARISSFVGVFLAFAYADFAGNAGSARRAAWMTGISLLSQAMGRNPDAVRAFAWSLLVGAVMEPLAIFDFSFGLSAAATSGLILFSRPIEQKLKFMPSVLNFVRAPIASTLAATLACSPFLSALSPSIPLSGILANVVAVPIGEAVALPACLSHLLLSPLPWLERGVALLGSGALLAVREIALKASSLAFLSVPMPRFSPWQLAVIGLGFSHLLLRRSTNQRLRYTLCVYGALLLLLEFAAIRVGKARGHLRVTFLDVGQGDSAIVDMPDGRILLIDGGGAVGNPVDPGRTVISPLLRSRRRRHVDIGVLTHPHPDHFTGLVSSLAEVSVGEFWDNGQGEKQGAGPLYAKLLSTLRERKVPIRRPSDLCGTIFPFADATLQVLSPCPDMDPSLHGNDNSLVLRISMGSRRVLLVGDAEQEEEAKILQRLKPEDLRADILKVGHHGSRTSSSAGFLDAVRPRWAVLSCGVRNRFGHPHPKTLRALSQRGISALRTDLLGGIQWETDGHRVWLSSTIGGEIELP